MAINKVEYGGEVLIDLTEDTVSSESMLSGITSHDKSGAKITGSISSKGAETFTPGTSNQSISAGQYISEDQTILGDANLVAENIAKDVSIFGITGTHEGGVDVSQVDAAPADVKTGKKYVDSSGVLQDGAMPSASYTPSVSVSSGSASMSASGFTASSSATSVYVNLSTTSGSAAGKATINSGGYIDAGNKSSSASAVGVSGNGNKLYIPTAGLSSIQYLNCGGSYTIPSGYHTGASTDKIIANSLASQTKVDSGKTAIDASHVYSGYQGWVNGTKITGTYTAGLKSQTISVNISGNSQSSCTFSDLTTVVFVVVTSSNSGSHSAIGYSYGGKSGMMNSNGTMLAIGATNGNARIYGISGNKVILYKYGSGTYTYSLTAYGF